MLHQCGIDVYRLLEAGQLTDSYLLERDQDFRDLGGQLGASVRLRRIRPDKLLAE